MFLYLMRSSKHNATITSGKYHLFKFLTSKLVQEFIFHQKHINFFAQNDFIVEHVLTVKPSVKISLSYIAFTFIFYTISGYVQAQ